jgi:phytoene dehydrogenase-like protein
MENRKVIVVGAGIGGLAAAYWLRERAYEVEILEATEGPPAAW